MFRLRGTTPAARTVFSRVRVQRAARGVALAALAAALTAAALATADNARGDDDPDRTVVRTDQGAVRGTVSDRARIFQGIPYAAPPVGDRRWRAPEPAPGWDGTRDARKPGPRCPQPLDGLLAGDEDCLYLDVTTPPHVTVGADKPVVVWLHGEEPPHRGRPPHRTGDPVDATALAEREDAVVVTVHHRLGAFGHLAHPAFGDSGNFALADQQAALHWVKRNARAFGGDPDRMTLTGAPSARASVCAQLRSPDAAHLFDHTEVPSGACSVGERRRGLPRALREGREFAARAGCVERDTGRAAACLRRLSTAAVAAASGPDERYGPVYGTRPLPAPATGGGPPGGAVSPG
ncbi:carboxylesterase family protein [Streptomyces alkaliterrae]|uniref:Carboxylesterase family protein n=1 Tax=Streptomyces alkaliterrae TaxID=2213162 RepID=A0A5P0YKD9_9ACTN|nr:carboxylesterase family protein [Streptomyces alkaliterrae]MBB1259076.1 carboxylesterase family protein [Streptomyces alkaliterrae]MQS00766.1 carboxylesterase family protein [Streptomyces alkaliterrae]